MGVDCNREGIIGIKCVSCEEGKSSSSKVTEEAAENESTFKDFGLSSRSVVGKFF